MFPIYHLDYVLGKLPEQLVIAAVSDLFVRLGSLGYEKTCRETKTKLFQFRCLHRKTFTVTVEV